MKSINRIRCRTIQKLLTAGINHRLYLMPTKTLFDRPELLIIGECPYAASEIIAMLKGRIYPIKVSQYGYAEVYFNERHVKFVTT